MTSSMLAEIREAPALVAAALREDADLYVALGRALRARAPSFVATVARGSSDHAASYAAYLIGILTGRVTASLPPSLVTRYDVKPQLAQALVIAVSQSGASPDLVRVMAAARAAGAMSAGVVNATGSALGAEVDWVLPQRAGAEHAVAATKSFVLTLTAIARLTAAWAEDAVLEAALARLPDRLEAALLCDWSAGLPVLSEPGGAGAYVVGRGPGLSIAREAALKLKETSYLHAEALSAAEIQHGPRAVVDRMFPVLAFGLADAGGGDTRALAADLVASEVPVLLAAPKTGGAWAERCGTLLPLPQPLHPLLDPIPAVLAFYVFAEALARRRGLDPDQPRGLRKVTKTL